MPSIVWPARSSWALFSSSATQIAPIYRNRASSDPHERAAHPGRVLGDPAEDEFAQSHADALSSHTVSIPRKPRPVEIESRPMPANDGLRLDENQRLLPPRPKPPQDHPKLFVGSGEPRLRVPLFQNGKLLPKSQIFQEVVAARTARLNNHIKQDLLRTEHEPVLAETSRISMQTAFGCCPLHGLHYPTEKTRVPVRPRGHQPKDVCVAGYGVAPLTP